MKLIGVNNTSIRWLFECLACSCCHYINHTWTITGPEDSLTVTPSIFVNKDRVNPDAHACHLFIRDGKIQYLEDCSHEYAGKTIEMVNM